MQLSACVDVDKKEVTCAIGKWRDGKPRKRRKPRWKQRKGEREREYKLSEREEKEL